MLILQIITLLLAVIGLILAFGSNIGWFTDEDKINFLKNIARNIDPKHPAAKKFLKKYFYSLPMSEEEKNIPIDKIIFVGTFTKHGAGHKDLMSGIIKVRNHKGETSQGLCSLAELENWTKTTPSWDWLAWSMITISTVVEIILFIFITISENNL